MCVFKDARAERLASRRRLFEGLDEGGEAFDVTHECYASRALNQSSMTSFQCTQLTVPTWNALATRVCNPLQKYTLLITKNEVHRRNCRHESGR